MTPRIRNLLRQAERVAKSGKRTAAVTLYREIITEAEDDPEPWIGLSRVLSKKAERREAIDRALALAPDNKEALRELDILEGRVVLEEELPKPVSGQTSDNEGTAEVQTSSEAAALEPVEEDAIPTRSHLPAEEHEPIESAAGDEIQPLVCYRHPDTETNLRCNRCERPICVKCANRTSVGYRCPECLREIESEFFTAKPSDYFLAAAVALPLSVVAGVVITFFGGGFGIFIYFIIAAIGSGVGTFIARLAHRAIGRRRGRYIPRLIAGIVALGAVLPAVVIGLPSLFFGGGLGVLTFLILPAIFGFVAASAAFYWLR